MAEAHSSLRACLVSLYARFAADGEEAQQEWLAFLRRVDGQLAEALTACVRRSLHEVARALQGEHRGAGVSPVFVVSVVLDTNSRWVGVGWGAYVCVVLVCACACAVEEEQGCFPTMGRQAVHCQAVSRHALVLCRSGTFCRWAEGRQLGTPHRQGVCTRSRCLHVAGWNSSRRCNRCTKRCRPPARVPWRRWRACPACCQRCWRAVPLRDRCRLASGWRQLARQEMHPCTGPPALLNIAG